MTTDGTNTQRDVMHIPAAAVTCAVYCILVNGRARGPLQLMSCHHGNMYTAVVHTTTRSASTAFASQQDAAAQLCDWAEFARNLMSTWALILTLKQLPAPCRAVLQQMCGTPATQGPPRCTLPVAFPRVTLLVAPGSCSQHN
jgi:hypothetical protein